MNELFNQLEQQLFAELPKFIIKNAEAISKEGEVYCMRLFFYDNHAPCFYLSLQVVPVKVHDYIVQNQRDVDISYYLFEPGCRAGFELRELIPNNPEGEPKTALAQTMQKIEGLDVNTHHKMVMLRDCLHRVCFAINTSDYDLPFATSPTFFIAPADGSQFFADYPEVDIVRSIRFANVAQMVTDGLLETDTVDRQRDEKNADIHWNTNWKKE